MLKNLTVVILSLLFLSGCATRGPMKASFVPEFHQQALHLKLRGVGSKDFLMMRVFDASFYLKEETSSEQALSNVPKHLEVLFYARISSADFTKYTINSIKDNISSDELKLVEGRFGRMAQLLPNLVPGDTFALTYEPGKGTSFVHNGSITGLIEGEDFGKAIFSTWIGMKPIDNALKAEILGLKNT